MKSTNNAVNLIKNGSDFISENLRLIQKAQSFILLQTYIFEEDESTNSIIEALIDRAYHGVKVFILIDGFGSKNIEKLNQHENIEFQIFSPLSQTAFKHIGRRLHSKVLLVDNQWALVGGINLSKRFIAPEKSPPWLDYSCSIEGEEVNTIFRKIIPLYKNLKLKHYLYNKPFNFQFNKPTLLKTNINDATRLKNQIHRSYVKAIKNAKKEITIVAPYFLPGKKFLNHLKKASMNGVKVELIFSANSDHPLERWSSKYLYLWLLKNNISIYEYDQSIVHGKIASIDESWTTIGSYNFNFLSRFSNHEVNIEIFDYEFTQLIQSELTFIKTKSELITKDKWKLNNNILRFVLEFLSYTLANLLTLISIFLFIRKDKEVDLNLLE